MRVTENRACDECGRMYSVTVTKPNHVFHAIMSIITMGLWIVIWLLAMLEAGGQNWFRGRRFICRSCARNQAPRKTSVPVVGK